MTFMLDLDFILIRKNIRSFSASIKLLGSKLASYNEWEEFAHPFFLRQFHSKRKSVTLLNILENFLRFAIISFSSCLIIAKETGCAKNLFDLYVLARIVCVSIAKQMRQFLNKNLYSFVSTACALLFRRGRSHVLQLHFFVRGIVLLGVVLCIRWRVLRIERPGDRKCRCVVAASGRLYLYGSDLTVATAHHRGFRLVSRAPDDRQKILNDLVTNRSNTPASSSAPYVVVVFRKRWYLCGHFGARLGINRVQSNCYIN